MAIEKFGFGADQDQIKIKGSGETQSISVFVQGLDAAEGDSIDRYFRGANRSMIVLDDGKVQSLSEYMNDVDLGVEGTIASQMIGAGANVIVDAGVMKKLAEKQLGAIQVLEEEPGIVFLEGEGEEELDPE